MILTSARSIHGINATASPIGPRATGSVQIGGNNLTSNYTTANVAYAIQAVSAGTGGNISLNLLTNNTTGSTAFIAGQAQVETATVISAGGITTSGTATVTVTAAGMTGSPKIVNVALTVAAHTSATLIATAMAAALNADTAYAAMFTATSSAAAIITTRKPTSSHTAPGGTLNLYAATDATLNLAIAPGTSVGITAAPLSADTTAGIVSSGVKIYGDGADFEGETLPTIATLYSVLFEAVAGIGVINGNVDDKTPFSAGSSIQWENGLGLTNETTLSIVPTAATNMFVTVLGKTA